MAKASKEAMSDEAPRLDWRDLYERSKALP